MGRGFESPHLHHWDLVFDQVLCFSRGVQPGLRLDDAAQQEAFAATLAPGLNAVWGPPGTGKAQVLAAVLVQLVREGRSALLVSNTNVAVDQALMKAAQVAGVLPGQMVRVGTPSLLGVADSPLLPLERACELRARRHHQRRRQIQQKAAALAARATMAGPTPCGRSPRTRRPTAPSRAGCGAAPSVPAGGSRRYASPRLALAEDACRAGRRSRCAAPTSRVALRMRGAAAPVGATDRAARPRRGC